MSSTRIRIAYLIHRLANRVAPVGIVQNVEAPSVFMRGKDGYPLLVADSRFGFERASNA